MYVLCLVSPTKVDTSQVHVIQQTHLYHHCWLVNNTRLSESEVSLQDMTKFSLDLWSQCFLSKHVFFPFQE